MGTSGQAGGEVFGRLQLVRGVLEGEEEGDGDRLEALFLHRVDEAVKIGGFKRCHDLARRGDALPRCERVLQGRERFGLVPADREDFAAVVALDRVDVPKILGGEQRDLCAPPGEQRVQTHRRPVNEEIDRRFGRNGRLDTP